MSGSLEADEAHFDVCPFCGRMQRFPPQTPANWGRGELAFRCARCGEPLFTHEAVVLGAIRHSAQGQAQGEALPNWTWRALRSEFHHRGVGASMIVVNATKVENAYAGSLLTREVRWFFFVADVIGCTLTEIPLEGQALVEARELLVQRSA